MQSLIFRASFSSKTILTLPYVHIIKTMVSHFSYLLKCIDALALVTGSCIRFCVWQCFRDNSRNSTIRSYPVASMYRCLLQGSLCHQAQGFEFKLIQLVFPQFFITNPIPLTFSTFSKCSSHKALTQPVTFRHFLAFLPVFPVSILS